MSEHGGTRTNSGPVKGEEPSTTKLTRAFGGLNEEERKALAVSIYERAFKSDKLAMYVTDHLYGKPKESLDVTSGGEIMKLEVNIIDAVRKVYGGQDQASNNGHGSNS